jgi:predicted phage terminase large subunit-like protein
MPTQPPAPSELELPTLHPGQLEVIDDLARFNVLACGRRWGKSTLGINMLVEPALEGFPTAWFAPTYKLLEEILLTVARVVQPITARRDVQAKRIELTTGGVIEFWTLDDPFTVARGRRYKRVILDEAAMVRNLQEAWQAAIRPTLTDFKGDAWFLSTPKGDNFFRELYDLGLKNQGDWKSHQFPTISNPFIDPTEIQSARDDPNTPELVFRQEYLAEFVQGSGTRVKREWLKISESPEHLEIVMGVDLAISTKTEADFTACVVLGRHADGRVFVLDSQRIQAPFHQVLEFIKRMAARWNPKIIGIEQVQYQAAVVTELLRKTTLPVRGLKPDKDKLTRFQPLEARYEQGLIYHAQNLPLEFEKELLAFPLGKHDDFCDALAYAFSLLQRASSYSESDLEDLPQMPRRGR